MGRYLKIKHIDGLINSCFRDLGAKYYAILVAFRLGSLNAEDLKVRLEKDTQPVISKIDNLYANLSEVNKNA